MSTLLKTLLTITLTLLTLSACKPGVYYPFGDVNAPQQSNPNHQTNPAAPKLGELTTTDLIGG